MTIYTIPTYAYRDQRRYLQRYLGKPPKVRVNSVEQAFAVFSTRPLRTANDIPSWYWYQGNSLPRNAKFVGKETGRTGIQLLGWSYLIYGRAFWDYDWELRETYPPQVFSQETGKTEKALRKGMLLPSKIQRMKFMMREKKVGSFARTTARVGIRWIKAPSSRHWSSRQNRKKVSTSRKRKSTLSWWYGENESEEGSQKEEKKWYRAVAKKGKFENRPRQKYS